MDSYYSRLENLDVTLIADQDMDDYSRSEYLEETMILDQSMDNYCSRLEDPEENWITDQNNQEFTHDYLATTKVRSLLENQIIENEEGDVENMLLKDEDDESYEIPEVKTLKRSSCLIGTWEVEITPEENSNITELGVCSSHFNFDNSKLYSSGTKQRKKTSKSIIHRKKCLLCNKYKRFFSRAFQIIPNITSRVTNNKRIRYICTNCFENNGGHLYIRQKSGNPSITWHNLPSPLLVKIAMKINKLENYSFTDKTYAKAEECRQFGEMLGETI
ncbi:15673_t:CDS:2, partial [Gigaspora rosea]